MAKPRQPSRPRGGDVPAAICLWERVCGDAHRRLAGKGPEGAKIEGARAPNDRHPFCNAGSLSAPAAVDFQQVEGAKHIRGRASGPTRLLRAGLSSFRDLGRLRFANSG